MNGRQPEFDPEELAELIRGDGRIADTESADDTDITSPIVRRPKLQVIANSDMKPDPDRIDRIIDLLRSAWRRQPAMPLGHILHNLSAWNGYSKISHVTDATMERLLTPPAYRRDPNHRPVSLEEKIKLATRAIDRRIEAVMSLATDAQAGVESAVLTGQAAGLKEAADILRDQLVADACTACGGEHQIGSDNREIR